MQACFCRLSSPGFLATSGVHKTTCHPQVHQLNGVAERAISPTMELTCLSLAASGSPIAFWDYDVTHAVDILIRTSGPPNTNASFYELLTRAKPRVMSVLPYGCRAYAVKPRAEYSKTHIYRAPVAIRGSYMYILVASPFILNANL
eukprot:4252706-Pleurochrysis_carterae.AAC.2